MGLFGDKRVKQLDGALMDLSLSISNGGPVAIPRGAAPRTLAQHTDRIVAEARALVIDLRAAGKEHKITATVANCTSSTKTGEKLEMWNQAIARILAP